jgi:methionine-rich copper-binding protein CopC
VVYTTTSTDNGDISTGSTTYSLRPVNDFAAFSINASTGAVTLTGDPDFEAKSSYSFTVLATDTAGNSSEQAVSLAINDIPDETAPTVSSVALTSAIGAQNDTLNAGDTARVTVTMSENTVVDTTGGTPRIALNIGGSTVFADYTSGSGSASLIFDYTVAPGDSDNNGISIPVNALEANGGLLADPTGNAADLDHGLVGNDASFIVDTAAPTLSSSTPDDEDTGFQVGDDIVLSFSEDVQAGTGNIVISDGSDTRTIDITDGSQVSISGNDVTIDPATDLNANSTYNVQIASGVITDEAGNAYAGISDSDTLNFDTEIVADTSIVVFDLIQDLSSDHSGRSFQSGVSYDIYIRVDSNNASVSLGGGDRWDGATNLGSDDRIILVGDGAAIQAPGGAVTQVTARSTAVGWQSSANAFGGLLQGSTFFRATSGNSDNVVLFDSSFGGATLGGAFSNSIPAGILTSQGLA